MTEQYKELFESELLNDETKQKLQEAINEKLEEQKTEIRNELEAEYAEKFVEQKQQLANQAYETIKESVQQEVSELKEDIEYYKELDVHYAKKLNEFKEEYKQKMAEKFSEYLDNQIQEGFSELKKDLNEAKENEIGRRIFEAFKEEFQLVEGKTDTGKRVQEIEKELNDLKEENEQLKRDQLMESLLSNLSGTKREVMSTILESVPYDRLEERYEEALPKVMNEDHQTDSSEGKESLTESTSGNVGSNEGNDQSNRDEYDFQRIIRFAHSNPRKIR